MPHIEEAIATVHAVETATSASVPLKVEISLVIPVMNEEQNIRLLYEKLSTQLSELGKPFEVIFVDDGSTDNTFTVLKQLYEENRGAVRVIRFRRN
ncbi:MAG: glycosyltransferase, partial [Ktedonobacteraceae bacterium]